jgi:dTDP-4-amino-4,6-dideoxygalactose transaminase
MNLDAMRVAVTPQTRVVIATHMYGYPTDVDAIREIVGSDQVLIIEDRALGMLASLPGTDGLRGDLGLFSFGLAKHLFTVQGGVIVTNSADYHKKLRAYRDREMDRVPVALWAKRWVRLLSAYIPDVKSALSTLRTTVQGTPGPGSDPEDSNAASTLVADDYASGLAGFQARVGLSQLQKLDEILRRRRDLAEFYDGQLRDVPGLTPAPILPGANYSHYTIRVEQRDAIGFRDRMRERGVEVGQVYDHVLPYRGRFRPYVRDTYPKTIQATGEVVNLPIHPRIRMSEAHYVAECARDILR